MAKFVPVLFSVCTAEQKYISGMLDIDRGIALLSKAAVDRNLCDRGYGNLLQMKLSTITLASAACFLFKGHLEAPRKLLRVSHCLPCRGRGVKAAGRVKKGGAGGKFTWGGLMSPGLDRAPSPVLDRNDPNYESGAVVYCHFGLKLALNTVKFSMT